MIANTTGVPLPVTQPIDTDFHQTPRRRGSILVAEDSTVTALIISKILHGLGWDVHVVSTGLEALRAYVRKEFALVIMDFEMPEMNGIETTVAIRNVEKLSGRHVTILGYSSSADGNACIAAGMDDYLQKPAPGTVLGARVATWCGQAIA